MRHEVDWKILSTLGFLVATIAVPTVASLVSPETGTAASLTKSVSIDSQARQPASSTVKSTDKKSHVITFDVQCTKNKVVEFKADSSFVQLRGHDCSKSVSKNRFMVTNKSNGFTASIFEVSQNEYQTDLIQLKPGENQIAVQFQSETGKPETQVLTIKATEL